MKNNIDENKIKAMYENNNTPTYDIKSNVINAISEAKKVPRINRKVLIAVALCVALLLVGTAGATGMLESFKVFNFPNDSTQSGIVEQTVMPEPTIIPEGITIISNPANDKASTEFTGNTQIGEHRVAYYFYEEGGASCSEGRTNIESKDYAKIEHYIDNGNISVPLPGYIPSGYTFMSGYIYFYLDINILGVEPNSAIIQDGITYLTYQLPKGYEKNIVSCRLEYENESGDYLHINLHLCPAFSDDNPSGYGASGTATAANVDIKGYGDSLLIHDKEKTYDSLYQLVLYKEIEPVETAMIFEKLMCDYYGDDYPEEAYVEILDAMTITISTNSLSRREIIKIAENLN